MSCAQPWFTDFDEPLSQGTLASLDLFESTQTSVAGTSSVSGTDGGEGEVTSAPTDGGGDGEPRREVETAVAVTSGGTLYLSKREGGLSMGRGTSCSLERTCVSRGPSAHPSHPSPPLPTSSHAKNPSPPQPLPGPSRLASPPHPTPSSSRLPPQPKPGPSRLSSSKRCYGEPPSNPLGFTVTDEEGNLAQFGTDAFVHHIAKKPKVKAETAAVYENEFKLLKQFIARNYSVAHTEMLLKNELPSQTVCTMVSSYLMSRVNRTIWKETGTPKHLDTTTYEKLFAGLVHEFRRHTNYNLYSKEFAECRAAKNLYLREAKSVPGLGELSGQTIALSRAQISYLLHSDHLNLDTPRGLISLFWVLTTLLFLPRVKSEVRKLTRNSFSIIKNPDGSPMAVVYTPKGTLKRDNGERRGSNAAATFKRPIALVCPAEPKLSFDIVLKVLFSHLDLLPWTGDRGEQPLFYGLVNPPPPPGSCFFLNKPMGIQTYDRLLRTVIFSAGLKVDSKQLPNQSIRPTAFVLHKSLGLSSELFKAFAGHVSSRTHVTYCRKSIDLLGQAASSMQEAVSGVAPAQPDMLQVEVVHQPSNIREVRKVKDYLPLVRDGQQFPGLLPLSGMTTEEIRSHLPNIRLVDDDEGSDTEDDEFDDEE